MVSEFQTYRIGEKADKTIIGKFQDESTARRNADELSLLWHRENKGTKMYFGVEPIEMEENRTEDEIMRELIPILLKEAIELKNEYNSFINVPTAHLIWLLKWANDEINKSQGD